MGKWAVAVAAAFAGLCAEAAFPYIYDQTISISKDFAGTIFLDAQLPKFQFGHAVEVEDNFLIGVTLVDVHVFERSSSSWVRTDVVKCGNCSYVADISLSGDTFALDDGTSQVAIFRRNASTKKWTLEASIPAGVKETVGKRVSLSGNNLVVYKETYTRENGLWKSTGSLPVPTDCSSALVSIQLDGETIVADVSKTGKVDSSESQTEGMCLYTFSWSSANNKWNLLPQLSTTVALGQNLVYTQVPRKVEQCAVKGCNCTLSAQPRMSLSGEYLAVNGIAESTPRVFVFKRTLDSKVWTSISSVSDSNFPEFGNSVVLKGSHLAVSSALSISGSTESSGSVVVYSVEGTDVTIANSVVASLHNYRHFGAAIAIDAFDNLVVTSVASTSGDTCRGTTVYDTFIDTFKLSSSLAPTRGPTRPPSEFPTGAQTNNGGDSTSTDGVDPVIPILAAVGGVALLGAGFFICRKSGAKSNIMTKIGELRGDLPPNCTSHFCFSYNPLNRQMSELQELLQRSLEKSKYTVSGSGSVPTAGSLVLFLANDTFTSVSVTADVFKAFEMKKPVFLIHLPGYRFQEDPVFHNKVPAETRSVVQMLFAKHRSIQYSSNAPKDVNTVSKALIAANKSRSRYVIGEDTFGDSEDFQLSTEPQDRV